VVYTRSGNICKCWILHTFGGGERRLRRQGATDGRREGFLDRLIATKAAWLFADLGFRVVVSSTVQRFSAMPVLTLYSEALLLRFVLDRGRIFRSLLHRGGQTIGGVWSSSARRFLVSNLPRTRWVAELLRRN